MFNCKNNHVSYLIQVLFLIVLMYSVPYGAQTSTNMLITVTDNRLDMKNQQHTNDQHQGSVDVLAYNKSGILTLSIRDGVKRILPDLECEVHSLSGKTILKMLLSSKEYGMYRLDTSRLPAGMYDIEIFVGSKSYTKNFFVIR